jgi:hypothetical protein
MQEVPNRPACCGRARRGTIQGVILLGTVASEPVALRDGRSRA